MNIKLKTFLKFNQIFKLKKIPKQRNPYYKKINTNIVSQTGNLNKWFQV